MNKKTQETAIVSSAAGTAALIPEPTADPIENPC